MGFFASKASLSSTSIAKSYTSPCGSKCPSIRGTSRMFVYRCMVQSHGLPWCGGRLSSRRHPEQHSPGSAQRRWRPRHLDGLWRSSRHRRYTYTWDVHSGRAITCWLQRGLGCPGATTGSAAGASVMVQGMAAVIRLFKSRLRLVCRYLEAPHIHASLMARVLLQWCSWCGT